MSDNIAVDSSTAAAAASSSAAWFQSLLQLILVAIFWGCTNPALNRASREKEAAAAAAEEQNKKVSSTTTPPSIFSLLLNYRFLVPFLLNQLGSVLYLHCLSLMSVSFVVPFVNSLTMVLTAITAALMGEEQKMNKRVIFGMLLLLCGISICVLSQHAQQQEREELQRR